MTRAQRRAAGPESAPDPQALRGLLERAQALRKSGQHREGVDCAQQAADLATVLGDGLGIAAAHRLLALHLLRLGDYEAAVRAGEEVRGSLQQLGAHGEYSDLLATLTMAYSELGLHDESLAAVTECLNAAMKSEDLMRMCWAYNRLGCAYDAMGDHAQAIEALTEALRRARELSDGEALFSALNNLSEAAIGLLRDGPHDGDVARTTLEQAQKWCAESVEVATASNSEHQLATALCNYGMLRGLAGERDNADQLLARAQKISAAEGYRPVELLAAYYRAQLLRARRLPGDAITALRAVEAAAREREDRTLLQLLVLELSESCEQAGDYRAALQEYRRYHELERQKNAEIGKARARLLMNRMELDQARREMERAQTEVEQHKAEKKQLEAQAVELDRRASEDSLTGLWNRRYIDAQLPRLVAHAKAHGSALSVAIADLDHFKAINDRFGHLTGDEVLRRIAATLRGHYRPADLVARMGGEEFIVVMADTTLAAATIACERLRQMVEKLRWPDLAPDLALTVSFGLSDTRTAPDPLALIACADAQLYRAKHNGRNRVEPFASGGEG